VVFPSSLPRYVSTGQLQTFAIPIRFVGLDSINRPVLGGLKISLIQPSSEAGELVLSSSIVATFAYLPSGKLANDYNPKVEITSVKLASTAGDPFPWSLIPNLPNVFSTLDLMVLVSTANSGDIFLSSQPRVSITPANILGQPAGAKVPLMEGRKLLLLPGQTSEEIILFEDSEDPASEAGAVFGIGLYILEVEVAGQLDENLLAQDNKASMLLIFPWKPTIVVMVLIFLGRRFLLRRYNSALAMVRKSLSRLLSPSQSDSQDKKEEAGQIKSEDSPFRSIKVAKFQPAKKLAGILQIIELPLRTIKVRKPGLPASRKINSPRKLSLGQKSTQRNAYTDRDLQFQQWREEVLNTLQNEAVKPDLILAATQQPNRKKAAKNSTPAKKQRQKAGNLPRTRSRSESPAKKNPKKKIASVAKRRGTTK
jgi:hypothetical protein